MKILCIAAEAFVIFVYWGPSLCWWHTTMDSRPAANPVLPFGIMLACTGAVAAAIGWQMLAGFLAGVVITLAAAAIAGADFE